MATIKFECPHCRTLDLAPVIRVLEPISWNSGGDAVEVIAHLSCPRCKRPSAAQLWDDTDELHFDNMSNPHYEGDPTMHGWDITGFWPSPQPVPQSFPEVIQNISPAFCEIHQEADKAEHFHLTQICGVGYRKGLEFLIKDYLINKLPDDENKIKSSMLGPCIERFIEDPRIKEIAKRAIWLGNDETHYERRWIGKDVQDLKRMIKLVVHWIETEHLTAEALNSMPDPQKP
jgi:hypothetical protein